MFLKNCSEAIAPHSSSPQSINHFFVDESGDLTLFDASGRIIVGNEGVSKTFIVSFALIPSPDQVHRTLEDLRASLLRDPYFRNVPSMQLDARKIALCFHAKDDLPEVRREIFRLLPTFGVKVQVALRRKRVLAEFAKNYFAFEKKKLQPQTVYDDLVKRLFKNVLHKASENNIVFAQREKNPRTEAFEHAIQKARLNFQRTWRKASNIPTRVVCSQPFESTGLQVIDYYLWALQRFFEKGEERFFNLVSNDFRLIMDLDDTRTRPYGEWYTDSNPLTAEKIMPV